MFLLGCWADGREHPLYEEYKRNKAKLLQDRFELSEAESEKVVDDFSRLLP